MTRTAIARSFCVLLSSLHAPDAFAASGHGLDGAHLSLLWCLLFVGLLLSIAIIPLLSHHLRIPVNSARDSD